MRGITKQSHSQKENSNGWVGEDGLLYKNVKKICFILMFFFFKKKLYQCELRCPILLNCCSSLADKNL